MQNRLKDRDRGGYTSDRYRPHDNYTNAFNMLAQIGLAEKEVTNSMRNAVTQAANVKALQDRLKFDVSSYSAKLKQLALDSSAGQQMKYEDLIQTYMDSNADERKKKITKWAEDNEDNDDYADNSDFIKAFNEYKEKVRKEDRETAEEKYKAISGIIDSHSNATQKYIEDFDKANNVFSLYPDNSVEDSQDNYYDDSAFIKAFADRNAAKKRYEAISDIIDSHSKDTQEYIEKFDKANVFSLYPDNPDELNNKSSVWKIIGSSIIKTNAIIGEFFKNLFSKGDE